MKRLLRAIRLLALCLPALAAAAGPAQVDKHEEKHEVHFAVLAHVVRGQDDMALRDAIDATDADNLAFLLVNGIKQAGEPCSDALYEHRMGVLETAKNGVFISLAASDWAGCQNSTQNSAAVERLNRLRELLFQNDFSLGATKLPLLRQSATAKFRSYAENMRWEVRNVMFATLNLPADNNNYLAEAGRNSEFEDRDIANREWLQRVFSFAARKKMPAIVLFSDSDPFGRAQKSSMFSLTRERDGYSEVRKQLNALAAAFPGKVLLVHGEAGVKPGAISWQKNLGRLAAGLPGGAGWTRVTVRPGAAEPFVALPQLPGERTKD